MASKVESSALDRRWENEPLPSVSFSRDIGEKGKGKDASQLISEKLLKGWALLDLVCHCPHSTPLLRDRNGQVLSYIS